jgi:hypothetical protein
MLSSKDVNTLGNILNCTWGKGSSRHHRSDANATITGNIQGDVLNVRFMTVVHFASERSLQEQMRNLTKESYDRLNKYVDNVKSQFREQTGKSLKLKEVSSKDDLELIQATSNSPRKIAYYRRFADLQVDV